LKDLIDLFKLAEVTRDQPQYGYNLAGVHRNELSDLAQHQYLVTFIAWQLAILIKHAGAELNVQKVMEISMIHDFGELFGSDISFYYAKANPAARKLAKEFEHENNNFLSRFFPDPGEYQKLVEEMEAQTTNESIVAKIADYTEVLLNKHRMGKLLPQDIESNGTVLKSIAQKSNDHIIQTILADFIESWEDTLPGKKVLDIIEDSNIQNP
jgi:5'-deoxynucleotidase YfbR-like HD superfamily hydrolase